jgi:BMFP domain-containing protein YqiC
LELGSARTVVMRPLSPAHRIGASRAGSLGFADDRAACGTIALGSYISMNAKILNDLNERMRQVFAQSPAGDLERNLEAMLTGLFARLDLVTREEFDVQRQVLLRTREKLTRLEAEMAELERKLQSGKSP